MKTEARLTVLRMVILSLGELWLPFSFLRFSKTFYVFNGNPGIIALITAFTSVLSL
jgi:hypothetical protein